MTMIGSISAKITADDSQFQQAIGRTAASSRKAANEVAKWGAAAAAAAAVAGAAIFKSTAESIKQLDALSYAANTSVADLQRMAYGARTVGIEQDKLADILKDVNDKIGDFNATGAGPMADFFENIGPKVGVTAQQFKNLSGPDALQLYVSSLEKANVTQAEMTFYMEALASDSTLLTPLLRDNGKAMGELSAEAERLGIGLSDIDVAKVQQANAAMGKISAIADSAAQQFTVVFAPAVAGALEKVVDLAEGFGGFGQIAENILGGIVKAVGVFANSFRAIQIIIKGLEAGFQGFAIGVNLIFSKIASGIEALVNTAIANINTLIFALNTIKPGSLGFITAIDKTVSGFFENAADSWSASLNNTLSEMHSLAMQELPSEGIEKWVEKVKAKAQEAAEATAAAVKGGSVEGASPAAGLSVEEQKALRERLDALRKAGMSELQLKQEAYNLDQEALISALENEMLTREEYNILAQGAAMRHQQALTDIDQQAADQRAAIAEMERRSRFEGMQTMFSNLSQLMNAGSRKLFEIGKMAAIAGAVQNAYESISNSYKHGTRIGGPPVGAAFAAAAGAASFAQVKAIKSQSFSSGAGAGMNFQGGQPSMPTGGQVGPQQPARNISISLTGDNFGAGGIRGLIREIGDQLGDGFNFNVVGG